jgi:hypothetical protein
MAFGTTAFPVLVLTGAIGAAALAASASSQAPPAPPPGPGLDLINERCGFCHTPAQAIGVRKTPANWATVVQSMIDRGAELSPEEQKIVVDYLSTHMAATGGSAATAPAATPAAAASPVAVKP